MGRVGPLKEAPSNEDELEDEGETLFESTVGSRSPSSYAMATFIWLLLLGPAAVNPATSRGDAEARRILII